MADRGDGLAVMRRWTLAIDRHKGKPNGDSLLDPVRKGTRAWYESHPEAWELVEVVPASQLAEAVEDQRAMAQVANAVESLRAGKISAMSAWAAVVDAVDRRGQ